MSSWISSSSAPDKRVRRSNRRIRVDLLRTLDKNVAVVQWLFFYLSETQDFVTLSRLSRLCREWNGEFKKMYNCLIPKWQVKRLKLFMPGWMPVGTERRWNGRLHSTPQHPSLRLFSEAHGFFSDVYCRYGRVIRVITYIREHEILTLDSDEQGFLRGLGSTIGPVIEQKLAFTGDPQWGAVSVFKTDTVYDFKDGYWLPVDEGKYEQKKVSDL